MGIGLGFRLATWVGVEARVRVGVWVVELGYKGSTWVGLGFTKGLQRVY